MASVVKRGAERVTPPRSVFRFTGLFYTQSSCHKAGKKETESKKQKCISFPSLLWHLQMGATQGAEKSPTFPSLTEQELGNPEEQKVPSLTKIYRPFNLSLVYQKRGQTRTKRRHWLMKIPKSQMPLFLFLFFDTTAERSSCQKDFRISSLSGHRCHNLIMRENLGQRK